MNSLLVPHASLRCATLLLSKSREKKSQNKQRKKKEESKVEEIETGQRVKRGRKQRKWKENGDGVKKDKREGERYRVG